jgi:hypothetical protein
MSHDDSRRFLLYWSGGQGSPPLVILRSAATKNPYPTANLSDELSAVERKDSETRASGMRGTSFLAFRARSGSLSHQEFAAGHGVSFRVAELFGWGEK